MKSRPNGGRNVRVVLDTNVVVSAMFFAGKPSRVLGAAIANRIRLYSSLELIDELSRTLAKKRLQRFIAPTAKTISQLVAEYAEFVRLVAPAQIRPVVTADPDDDILI